VSSEYAWVPNADCSRNRWQDVISSFQNTYGSKPSHIIRAPGRVNVLGEHIDYSLFVRVYFFSVDTNSPSASHTRCDRARHPYSDILLSLFIGPILSHHQQHLSHIRIQNIHPGEASRHVGGRGWAWIGLDSLCQSEYCGGRRSKHCSAGVDAVACGWRNPRRCRSECESHIESQVLNL
jgi:hypothetical protein